jgi:membrane associated rhomboid family serine protease
LNAREPIFNVPTVVLALIGIFIAVHVLLHALPQAQGEWLLAALAFIPARLAGAWDVLPGGKPAVLGQFITHVFVHADLTHLVINSAWFLAFASPVVRRTGSWRFLAFFLLSGIGGALLFLAVNRAVFALLIGASGAISGLMGAALRFLFNPHQKRFALALGDASYAPLIPLRGILRDRRLVAAIVIWTAMNVILAWGLASLVSAGGIAWEAHLGGFYAGIACYGLFDRPPGHREEADAASAR